MDRSNSPPLQETVAADVVFLEQQFGLSADEVALYRRVNAEAALEAVQRKRVLWEALCVHFADRGVVGTVLHDADCRRWCMITPDPKPGMYRYTLLDERGFFGHGEYYTPELAVVEAFRMGYRYLDEPDRPDQLIAGWS